MAIYTLENSYLLHEVHNPDLQSVPDKSSLDLLKTAGSVEKGLQTPPDLLCLLLLFTRNRHRP